MQNGAGIGKSDAASGNSGQALTLFNTKNESTRKPAMNLRIAHDPRLTI
jgi:hypothetical protein